MHPITETDSHSKTDTNASPPAVTVPQSVTESTTQTTNSPDSTAEHQPPTDQPSSTETGEKISQEYVLNQNYRTYKNPDINDPNYEKIMAEEFLKSGA